MQKASIAIFKKSVEYNDESSSITPDEVFEAAKRVADTKATEILKSRDGFYVVQYSETGPFKEDLSKEWLPVYVARISKWSSGGIKKQELEAYEQSK